jgi:hypothetical protein
MNSERENIVDRLIEITYFMRGSVQYEHLLDRSAFERQRMTKFIEKRLEQEGKRMNPVY